MFKTTRTWLIDYNHIYTEDPYIWFDMYVSYVILPQNRYFSDCIVHQSPMPPGVLELYLAHYAFASRPHFIEDGWLDWICLTTTHVLQDILAVLHR